MVSEAPSPVLLLNASKGEDGFPIEGDDATVAVLGRARVQPGHTPTEVHAGPFQPQDFAHPATSRQGKLHHGAQMLRQCLKEPVGFLPRKSDPALRFSQYPYARESLQPVLLITSQVQDATHDLQGAVDGSVSHPFHVSALFDKRPEHVHVNLSLCVHSRVERGPDPDVLPRTSGRVM